MAWFFFSREAVAGVGPVRENRAHVAPAGNAVNDFVAEVAKTFGAVAFRAETLREFRYDKPTMLRQTRHK